MKQTGLLDVLKAQERVVSELSKEIVRLRAENERLRDALRDILAYSANARMAPADKAQGMPRIALAALKDGEA